MTKTTLDHLVAARAVIAHPDNWCQGKRNHRGRHCALGAIDIGTGSYFLNHKDDELFPVVAALVSALPPGPVFYGDSEVTTENFHGSRLAGFLIAGYNNTHTHAEVLALFDRAIARQRQVAELLDAPAEAEAEAEAKDRELQLELACT